MSANARSAGRQTILGQKNDVSSEVENKDTIFSSIDTLLNNGKPPSLEYIHILNYCYSYVPLMNWNVFGHVAIKYTRPSTGEQVLVDVESLGRGKLGVFFMRPEDFFYSTGGFGEWNIQHGVYNRNMIGIRIEECDEEILIKLDEYFKKLEREKHDKRFSWILSWLWKRLPYFKNKERGNCTEFVTRGMKAAGLIHKERRFPKQFVTDLLENSENIANKDLLRKENNVHMVFYRRIGHATHTYTGDIRNTNMHSLVSPTEWKKNWRYLNVEKYADAVVSVPEGRRKAEVHTGLGLSACTFFDDTIGKGKEE